MASKDESVGLPKEVQGDEKSAYFSNSLHFQRLIDV